jgi:hypothetical protein
MPRHHAGTFGVGGGPTGAPEGPRRHRSPTVTDVPTALKAHERVGGHAGTRPSVLARPVIAPYTRQIVDPLRLKFLSHVRFIETAGGMTSSSANVEVKTDRQAPSLTEAELLASL